MSVATFAIVMVIMGILVLVGLYAWTRSRQLLGVALDRENLFDQMSMVDDTDSAVLVTTMHGQLVHINDTTRQLFGTNGDTPSLEYIAGHIQPAENFFALFNSATQTSFQLDNKWMEATSHGIPTDDGRRMVIVMREMSTTASNGASVDFSSAMSTIHKIGDLTNASMNIEQVSQVILDTMIKQFPAEAGEICIWNANNQTMEQRGWVGNTLYLISMAERGGRYAMNEGVVGWVAQHQKPLIVNTVDELVDIAPIMQDMNYRSSIAIPLQTTNRLFGTIAFYGSTENHYEQSHLSLLQAISSSITIAIQNAELYTDQENRIKDIASLQDIAEQPRSEEDATPIYGLLTERIARLLEVDMCGVFTYNEDRVGLIPELPFYGMPDSIAQSIFLSLPHDTLQRDIWENQPYWFTNDVTDEPLLEALGLAPLVEVAGIRNTSLMPMAIGGERIGIVAVSNKHGEDGFTPRDIQNLQMLIAQASIVVENVRLYQRERRIDTELVGLQEMTHAIGSLSHESEFYSEITDRIARLTESEMCGILLFNETQQRLESQLPFYGVSEDLVAHYQIRLTPGTVIADLWDDDDYWYSNRVVSDTLVFEAGLDQLAEAVGVQKTLIAVMSAGGRRLGVVQVSNKTTGADYDDNDARLLLIFATQAAAIIENARLYREVQLRADQSNSLRVVAELAGSLVTTNESFEPVLDEISRFIDSPIVYINVLDQSAGSLITYPRWVYGVDIQEPLTQNIYAENFEHSVALSGRSFFSDDIKNDKRVTIESYKEIAARFELKSTLLVPLGVGEKHLGELGVGNRTSGGTYSEDDVRALMTIAAQISATVDRLLLYEATGENLRRRMDELDAISRVSNELTLTFDLDQILDVIRIEAMNATKASGSTVVLLKPHEQWRKLDEPFMDKRLGDADVMYDLADIEREAVLHGADPVLVTNYDHSDMKSVIPTVKSAAAAILYLDQVVGVIHVHHSEANRFDERAAAFLMTLSTKASLGYQSWVRYTDQLEHGQRLRSRVEQLNRIFELGQMVQSNTDPVIVLEAIAYSVQQSVGYDTVLMTMVDQRVGTVSRVAHAGLPIMAFEETKGEKIALEKLESFFQEDTYRTGECYFYPIEKAGDWYFPELSVLSTAFESNRSIDASNTEQWHDGDMLIVRITGSVGNQLLGTISLDRPYNNKRPDRQTLEVLEIFAHQAAAMIENTRLFRESQKNAEQEARLNDISETVASTLDFNELVQLVAKGTLNIVPFSVMSIAVSDSENQDYEMVKAKYSGNGELAFTTERPSTLENTALGYSLQERKEHIYILGEGNAEEQNFADLLDWQANGEKVSVVIPLITGSEQLGAIHIGSVSEHDIDNYVEAMPILHRMGQLVAGSIQSARLFNQAVTLQVLNQSVVESIQQGIVVLDQTGHIINMNNFMVERYGWTDEALHRDMFEYRPSLAGALKHKLTDALKNGQPAESIGYRPPDSNADYIINLYLYPLRYGNVVQGAVVLVEDVTERAELERAIENRANQLAALTEVSTRITASLERDEIVDLAMEEMGWIIPFDTMTMWRRTGSYMVLEGVSGIDYPSDNYNEKYRILISEHTQVQELADTQRVLTLTEMSNIESQTLPGEANAKSWMGVPLVNQGHVVGMIILVKLEEDLYITRSEQHVAFAFASQVAIALANAELFEQTFERTNELGTLLEAAQATALTRELNDVFRTVAELMFSALDMDECSIMIWDEVDSSLDVQVRITRDGVFDVDSVQRADYELSKYEAKRISLESREVIVIVEGQDLPYKLELEELTVSDYGARMLVPLVIRETSIGLIQLQQFINDESTLTQQKVRLARALGAQVAVAIENARLSSETISRFEELLTINSLSQAISSTLKIDDMFEVIREQVPAVTGAQELYLALYDKEADVVHFPLAVSKGEIVNRESRPINTDEVSYIIKNRRPLSLGADYFSIEALRKSMGITNGEDESKSYMGVPLIAGDEILGVLAVRDQERTRAFNLNDERILTTVSTQLAAAIQNSRLFDQVTSFANELNVMVEDRTEELEDERDRLDTLYQITSELMRTLDMDQLLGRALGMVSKAVNAEDGVILLSDPATDKLFCRASLTPNSIYQDDTERNRHPAEVLASWLIQNESDNDHVIVVKDLDLVEYWDNTIPHASQWHSALAVMLETNEDPMGVMVFLNSEKDAFTETQLKLLVAAANQVSSAINSADLYQLIRDQAERLGKLLRAEQEDAQKNTAILESIADAVLLANAEGRIILFNSAAERILGLPRGQVQGHLLSDISVLYGGSAYKWIQMLEKWTGENISDPMAGGDFISEQVELGELTVSMNLSPVFIGEQFLGTVSVFRDITRDIEVDRIKSEFITNVSHEFRTPLTPIKGYTDLLLMGAGGELSDSQSEMLGTIKENVERLTVLVNDVLNIAKIDSQIERLAMNLVNLQDFIPDEFNKIAGRSSNTNKNIQATVSIDDNVPLIRADREKLIRIFSNLVDNAFNYTLANGKIDVNVTLQPTGRSVIIAIADTGVGIPDHFREAVWRRFERYDDHALELDIAGTGLGLSLVKELVSLHNGNVRFDSEVGVGTTFYVELPVEQPSYITDTIEMPQLDTGD
jgi:PAS domain S-box-containing protein